MRLERASNRSGTLLYSTLLASGLSLRNETRRVARRSASGQWKQRLLTSDWYLGLIVIQSTASDGAFGHRLQATMALCRGL